MLESLDCSFGSLRKRLDTPVFEIFHISANLMTRGRTLRKIPEADTLNLSTNKKLSCNNHRD